MITTKRQAIAACKSEANALIDQLERKAKGWDKGVYRDDDTLRLMTVQEHINFSVDHAFLLSSAFAE